MILSYTKWVGESNKVKVSQTKFQKSENCTSKQAYNQPHKYRSEKIQVPSRFEVARLRIRHTHKFYATKRIRRNQYHVSHKRGNRCKVEKAQEYQVSIQNWLKLQAAPFNKQQLTEQDKDFNMAYSLHNLSVLTFCLFVTIIRAEHIKLSGLNGEHLDIRRGKNLSCLICENGPSTTMQVCGRYFTQLHFSKYQGMNSSLWWLVGEIVALSVA